MGKWKWNFAWQRAQGDRQWARPSVCASEKNKDIRHAFIPQPHHKPGEKKKATEGSPLRITIIPKCFNRLPVTDSCLLPRLVLGLDSMTGIHISLISLDIRVLCGGNTDSICPSTVLVPVVKRRVSILVVPSFRSTGKKTVLASAACPVKDRLPIQKTF